MRRDVIPVKAIVKYRPVMKNIILFIGGDWTAICTDDIVAKCQVNANRGKAKDEAAIIGCVVRLLGDCLAPAH
jgi:hypothetical protein